MDRIEEETCINFLFLILPFGSPHHSYYCIVSIIVYVAKHNGLYRYHPSKAPSPLDIFRFPTDATG